MRLLKWTFDAIRGAEKRSSSPRPHPARYKRESAFSRIRISCENVLGCSITIRSTSAISSGAPVPLNARLPGMHSASLNGGIHFAHIA